MISPLAAVADKPSYAQAKCLSSNSLKHATQRKFSTAANSYAAHANVQKQAANDLFKLMTASDNAKQDYCIDLGAGPLVNTHALQGLYRHVLAIDLSHTMLKSSNVDAPRICADMDNLPLQENSVDVVFSNFAVQWSANFETLMHALYKTLKPGGRAYISAVVEGSLHEIKTAFSVLDSHSRINRFQTQNNINQSVINAGFIVNSATKVIYTDQFTNPLNAIHSIKAIGATSQNHSTQRAGLLTKSALKKVCAAYPLINNRAHVSYHVVLLSLEKVKT